MPRLKDTPKVDFPREKLAKYGPDKLSDRELLALLLGSGIKGANVLELSGKVLKLGAKIGFDKLSAKDLQEIKGLGKAKSSQIIALLALGRRLNTKEVAEILSPQKIFELCADIKNSKKEHFLAFYLDTQNRLIERQIISIGTLDSSLVHPREVFEPAVRLCAASVIVAHNHPSGVLEPSAEDREVMYRLRETGKMLGIELSDHVIVSGTGFFSFKRKNLL